MAAKRTAKRTKQSPILRGDSVTLVIKGEKDGKLRLTCLGWEDARVVLPGNSLDISNEAGQVVIRQVMMEPA